METAVLTLVGLIVFACGVVGCTTGDIRRSAGQMRRRIQRSRPPDFQLTSHASEVLTAYDPSFRMDGTYNPTSKQEGFFQGFAFTQESRGWDLSSGLEGSFWLGYVLLRYREL